MDLYIGIYSFFFLMNYRTQHALCFYALNIIIENTL